MKEFRIAVEIQAPPDKVWAVMRDIERWPEWNQAVTSARRLDSGPLAVGSRARIVQPKLAPAVWQVTELDEGTKNFTWTTRRLGVQVTGEHLVEASGDGSRVTLSLQVSGLLGPLIAVLTSKLTERYLALEAQGLKERSEGSL